MRKRNAVLKTVMALRTSYNELIHRDDGVPGMMLVSGESGAGKSVAVSWLCDQVNGVMVRALTCDTLVTLLQRILRETGKDSNSWLGNGVSVAIISEYLAKSRRTLFVDECDALMGSGRLLETLRDIHDLHDVPVVLIGHAGIERRMAGRPQLYRRISQWVNFLPCDIEDATILARSICEIKVQEDLLKYVHRECRGNPGLMTVALSRIEAFAKANKLTTVNAERWNEQRLFVNPNARPRIAVAS